MLKIVNVNVNLQVFDKSGNHKFNFGVAGKEEGQLWYPRKVAVVRATGKFVVCDRGNERSRMQIFTKNGHFLKKIAVSKFQLSIEHKVMLHLRPGPYNQKI